MLHFPLTQLISKHTKLKSVTNRNYLQNYWILSVNTKNVMVYRQLQVSIKMHFEAVQLLYILAAVEVCLGRIHEFLGGKFSEVT